jgi:hypothetical protein
MESANEDLNIERAIAHFLALRRIRDRMNEYGRLAGLMKQADFHMQTLQGLASGFCDGGAEGLQSLPLAAMSGQ